MSHLNRNQVDIQFAIDGEEDGEFEVNGGTIQLFRGIAYHSIRFWFQNIYFGWFNVYRNFGIYSDLLNANTPYRAEC